VSTLGWIDSRFGVAKLVFLEVWSLGFQLSSFRDAMRDMILTLYCYSCSTFPSLPLIYIFSIPPTRKEPGFGLIEEGANDPVT